MSLLEDEEQHRSQKLLRQQQAVTMVPRLLFFLTLPVIFCVMLLLFTLEVGGTDILKWFDHYPALSAHYNPHHWTTRLLAWTIALLFLRTVWHCMFIFAKRLSLWWKVWREPARKEMDNQGTMS